MKTRLYTLLCLLCSVLWTEAATHNSPDGTPATVQSNINYAAAGDTVTIPAGSFTWAQDISINKPIHLRGAGGRQILGYSRSSHTPGTGSKVFTLPIPLGSTTDTTVSVNEQIYIGWKINEDTFMIGTITALSDTSVTVNVTSFGVAGLVNAGGAKSSWFFRKLNWGTRIVVNDPDTFNYTGLIHITESTAGNVEVSDLHFEFTSGSGQNGVFIVSGVSGGEPVILHDLSLSHPFNGGRNCFFLNFGVNRGVIYNTSIDCGWSAITEVPIQASSNPMFLTMRIDGLNQGTSWSTAHTKGTADTTGKNNIYVENCYFGGIPIAQATDAYQARFVVRHCTLDNAGLGSHGKEGVVYSVRHWEFYNNRFIWDPPQSFYAHPMFTFWFCRGGTGMIFNNYVEDIDGDNKAEWLFIQYACTRASSICIDCNDYPNIPQQVGGGHNGSAYHIDPVYIWNNTNSAGQIWTGKLGTTDSNDPGDICPNAATCRTSTIFQANRDYFLGVTPVGYTPYQYPHPLVSGAPPDETAPSTPTGLVGFPITENRIDLVWQPSTDNVGVSQYYVVRSNAVAQVTNASFTTSYSDTNLIASSTYKYSVQAVDFSGNMSALSASTNVTTLAHDAEAPSIPTGLTITTVTSSRVSMQWNASTDNIAVSYYQILRDDVQVGMGSDTNFTDFTVAPATAYTFKVKAVDAGTNISAASTGASTTTSNAPAVPSTLLKAWYIADTGVTNSAGAVSAWSDQSGTETHAVQATAANKPTLITNAINGHMAVRFDGATDFLTFTQAVNTLTGLTLVVVCRNSTSQSASPTQAENAAIFWNEISNWGTVYLSPFQSTIFWRFGTTQSGNRILYTRPATIGSDYSITISTHSNDVDRLYVNGSLVLSQGGKTSALAGNTSVGNLGRGYNNDTFFNGDIAEVLIYTKCLDPTELSAVEEYLEGRYLTPASPQGPVANFTSVGDHMGVPPLTVIFTNATIGEFTNALWTFGDGNTSTSTGLLVTNTYADIGTNDVTLRVVGTGITNTFTAEDFVVITNALLSEPGMFDALSSTYGIVPLAVVFTNTTTTAYTNAIWVFGDGNTLLSPSLLVTNTYLIPGIYTVGLSTINGGQTNDPELRVYFITGLWHPQRQRLEGKKIQFGGKVELK